MMDPVNGSYAALILRLGAAIFTAHAMLKWRVFTIPGNSWHDRIYQFAWSPGWPGLRYSCFPLTLETIIAVHGKNGWLFSN
jgi:putative oxidoreductase